MAIARRLRQAALTLLAIFGLLLWLAALLLFSQIAENSDDFSQALEWILPINTIGISVLAVLIVLNVVKLFRDYRMHVPGVRLRTRMVLLLFISAAGSAERHLARAARVQRKYLASPKLIITGAYGVRQETHNLLSRPATGDRSPIPTGHFVATRVE